MKRLVCGAIIPDCRRVFTGVDDQEVLDHFLKHAADDHGLTRASLPFIELVMTHTRPFSPTRDRGHLRAVEPDQSERWDARGWLPGRKTAGDRASAGNRTAPGGAAAADRLPDSSVRRPQPRLSGGIRGAGHETFRHQCLLYTGISGFLDTVLPFVRDGLGRQEPIMVAVAEPRLRALRSALGPDAHRVLFADMADLGHNPARIIPAWRAFTDRCSGAGRPVRGVGEPIWAGRRPAEIVEAQLHEALLNLAVSPNTPLWLLCPYDTITLDEQVVTEAHRSHPVVVESGSYRASTRYGGSVHVERLFGAELPDPILPRTTITFDPHQYRHINQIIGSAVRANLPVDRTVKLAAVIDEIALACHREAGRVDISIWRDKTALVCEVTDPGMIDDPMIGRGVTLGAGRRERGIRLANELCDLVQIRTSPTGTTIRVHSWR